MFTYPKSSVHVLRMLMHLTLGHVTLPHREFHSLKFFPQLDLGCRALPQISSFAIKSEVALTE